MSRYGTGTQEAYLYGEYAATRPNRDQPYAGFAQPSFAWQYTDAQARESHAPSTVNMPYIASSQFEPRDTPYQVQYPPTFNTARSRHLPEIVNFHPKRGAHGDKLKIYIQFDNQSTTQPFPNFSAVFGGKRCSMALSKTERAAPYFSYLLETDVPPWESLGCSDSQVPLFLEMQDEYGQSIGTVPVGNFSYSDFAGYEPYPQSAVSRKRKLSDQPEAYMRAPAKRAQPSWDEKPRPVSSFENLHHPTTSSPTVLASIPSSYYAEQYAGSPQQQAAYLHRLSQQSPYSSLPDVKVTRAAVDVQPSPVPSYDTYVDGSPANQTPKLKAGTPKQVAPSPSHVGNPTFVRTSTIQSGRTTATPISASSQPFNPYAVLPTKATLKLDGDLNAMAENWEEWEWEEKRRLVQFERKQEGSTITATFHPISREERGTSSPKPCISCIWWEEKQECYVTSVDTIQLLESLVGARFTVEEKNRIRRNLEGFRPLTVSKVKADSEEFFKLIMRFPPPKPRNIEKDVKVFPWKVLGHALKKIINKYSASYSSTAGPLLTPVTSGYASGGRSEAGTELHHTASPRSVSSSAPSITYQSSMTSTTISPNIKASAGSSVSGGHPDLQLSMPQHGAAGQALAQWQATPPQSTHQYPAGYAGRPSVDYSAYFAGPSPPRTMGAAAAQSMQLQRTDVAAGTEHVQQPPESGGYKLSSYSHQTTQSHG